MSVSDPVDIDKCQINVEEPGNSRICEVDSSLLSQEKEFNMEVS